MQQFDLLSMDPCEDIALNDANLHYWQQFVDKPMASNLYASLLNTISWQSETIRIAGIERIVPRLTAWYGDGNASYRYSGIQHKPLPWTDELKTLKERIEQATGHNFNSVLCNLYRDGQDSVAWHSDDEIELGENPIIASLSLGETRRFEMKHKQQPRMNYKLELNSGSLLVMSGKTQQHWYHRIPKQENITNPRINLTFRSIIR